MERDISCVCVCVWCLSMCMKIQVKKTHRGRWWWWMYPSVLNCCVTWEKRRRNCNISRQLSSLLFGEEFLRSKNVRHYLGSILRQNQTFSAKKHFDLINNQKSFNKMTRWKLYLTDFTFALITIKRNPKKQTVRIEYLKKNNF